jgi:Cu+-exporting ATPase
VGVHVALERVIVEHAPDVRADDLVAVVTSLGYTVLSPAGAVPRVRSSVGRLVVSAVCVVPTMVAMFVAPLHGIMHPLVQFGLATIMQTWVAAPLYDRAWRAVRQRTISMEVLIVFATTCVYVASVWAWVNGLHVYFETSAALVGFVTFGSWIEQRMKRIATSSLTDMLLLHTRTVSIERDGSTYVVPIAAIKTGDEMTVQPGSWIPADGTIVAGHTHIDESMRTGESVPHMRTVGDAVYAASMNTGGTIRIRADADGSDTAVVRMLRIAEQATRAPAHKMADRIAAVFVPLVLVLACGTGVYWAWVSDASTAMMHALAVLVMACPCALGLAIPLTLSVAQGKAVRQGIVFHDPIALEALARVDVVVLDKTGTMTLDSCTFVDVCFLREDIVDEQTFWALVAAAEHGAVHGVGIALGQEASRRTPLRLDAPPMTHPGLGVAARIDRWDVRIGAWRWLAPEMPLPTPEWDDAGYTVVGIAIDGCVVAVCALELTVRPEAVDVVRALQDLNLRVHMCTGDRMHAASSTAARLGIAHVDAEVLPEEKRAIIQEMRHHGHTVAMVGDGLNDAPALAAADVGVCVASANDVSKAAAHVTLLRTDVRALVDAVVLARQTRIHVRVSVVWAILYNVCGLPLAMAGVLTPMTAGGAMVLSSLSVVAYSMVLHVRGLRTPFRASKG